MRLNRGTLALLVVLIIVIVGALLVSQQQDAADVTPSATPDPSSGPLFTDLPVGTVARVEVRNPADGTFIEMNRLDATNWGLAGTNQTAGRVADNAVVESNMAQLVNLQYTARFESAELADFGLAQPAYVLFIETGTGEGFTLYIGNRTPTNPRYYAVLQPGIAAAAAPEATAEVTPEMTFEAALPDPFFEITPAPPVRAGTFTLSGPQQIAVIPQTIVTTLTGWLLTPPYAAPTPTPPPSPTPEATVEAAAVEATAEATAESAPDAAAEATREATVEATAESGS